MDYELNLEQAIADAESAADAYLAKGEKLENKTTRDGQARLYLSCALVCQLRALRLELRAAAIKKETS